MTVSPRRGTLASWKVAGHGRLVQERTLVHANCTHIGIATAHIGSRHTHHQAHLAVAVEVVNKVHRCTKPSDESAAISTWVASSMVSTPSLRSPKISQPGLLRPSPPQNREPVIGHIATGRQCIPKSCVAFCGPIHPGVGIFDHQIIDGIGTIIVFAIQHFGPVWMNIGVGSSQSSACSHSRRALHKRRHR